MYRFRRKSYTKPKSYRTIDNSRAYNRIYGQYESLHGEIFNSIEQERLRASLAEAILQIKSESICNKALDYGCGSGNLTRHLLDLGLYVTSADISDNFLTLISEKYKQTGKSATLKINGLNLSEVKSSQFDFIGTYSVLHHIPDYLSMIAELVRVLMPGGVIYLDHEANGVEWSNDVTYKKFINLAYPTPTKKCNRFLSLSTYTNKIRNIPHAMRVWANPRYMPEGDIHVWPDDHIEWDKVEQLLLSNGCEIVCKEDYLLYKAWYPLALYEEFKGKCTDMRLVVARRQH